MRTLVAMLLMTTCAMAQEPVQTCTGRVKVHVDKGNYWGGGRLLHVGIEKKDEGCGQFYTVPNSLNGKQILQTCSIGSSCRVEARLEGGDGGIDSIISVTRLKDHVQICHGEWTAMISIGREIGKCDLNSISNKEFKRIKSVCGKPWTSDVEGVTGEPAPLCWIEALVGAEEPNFHGAPVLPVKRVLKVRKENDLKSHK